MLERNGRNCAHCGIVGVPLNFDHVIPKARGGPDRLSNLVPACVPCNEAKGATPVEVLLAVRPAVLARIQKPLKDAAAVDATR